MIWGLGGSHSYNWGWLICCENFLLEREKEGGGSKWQHMKVRNSLPKTQQSTTTHGTISSEKVQKTRWTALLQQRLTWPHRDREGRQRQIPAPDTATHNWERSQKYKNLPWGVGSLCPISGVLGPARGNEPQNISSRTYIPESRRTVGNGEPTLQVLLHRLRPGPRMMFMLWER